MRSANTASSISICRRRPSASGARSARRAPKADLGRDLRRARRVRQRRDDLLGDRRALDAALLARMRHHPDALLEAVDRELAVLEDAVLDGKAALAPFAHAGFADQVLAPARGDDEARARIDQRRPDRAVSLPERPHREAGAAEEMEGGGVEPGEIARIEDDAGGIAIAPFDAEWKPVDEHCCSFLKG